MGVSGFEFTGGVRGMFNHVITSPGIDVGSLEADQLDAAALQLLKSSGLTPERMIEEGFQLSTLWALDYSPAETVAAVVANGLGRVGSSRAS